MRQCEFVSSSAPLCYNPQLHASHTAGTHMTVDELVAKQTRIERQETPHAASVSFERHAADAFQSYVRDALAFSIKRGGLLYGTVDDGGKVSVEAIYELQQVGFIHALVRLSKDSGSPTFIMKVSCGQSG